MTQERFIEAYRDHAVRILRFCIPRTTSRAEAEDITAETFARFLDRHDAVDEAATLAWLYKVAKNLCVDSARKARRLRPLDDHGTIDSCAVATDVLAGRLDVWGALRKLPADQQQVVYLRSVEDQPFGRIGELLGISEGSARMRYHRAVRSLGATLRRSDQE